MGQSERWHRHDSLAQFLGEQIRPKSLYWPLVTVAFYTGLLDATTYADFQAFASNQTGNVIILTVGATDAAQVNLRNSGCSLAGYLVAGFIGGQVGHLMQHRSRWWLFVSNNLQNLIFMITLILFYGDIISVDDLQYQWVYLLILAVASGGQVAIARNVQNPEVPTAMLSSPMIDFVTDPYLLRWTLSHPDVRRRNRRFGYIFSLVSGSFIGAVMHRYVGTGPVLILSFIMRFLVTIAMFVAHGEHEDELALKPEPSRARSREPEVAKAITRSEQDAVAEQSDAKDR